jgi:RimJ/RimL family protein N-acetyltransferase
MITLREARVEDAPTLCAAEQEISRSPGRLVSQPDELSAKSFVSSITALTEGAGCYLVAEDEGEIVGHGFLKPMDLRAISHVFRLTIAVHSGHTGRGVGTAIMAALCDWACRAPGVEKLELTVRSTNEPALKLYRKFGFVEEGRFRNRIRLADGSYIDDIGMAWFPKHAVDP